jgi:hypothetical protein
MRSPGSYEFGKITEAAWAISQFAEEIEADLARYYRLELSDLFQPGSSLTWRRLLVLLKHLPPESAVNTAIRNRTPEDVLSESDHDPATGKWSTVETLLAVLIDEMRIWQWIYVQAHTDKKLPRPDPIRRPGVASRPKRRLALATVQAMDPRLRGLSPEETQSRLDELTGGRKRGDW